PANGATAGSVRVRLPKARPLQNRLERIPTGNENRCGNLIQGCAEPRPFLYKFYFLFPIRNF
ncbi:hypothetical protein ACI80_09515, partial [Neisseria gonorrhoeae]